MCACCRMCGRRCESFAHSHIIPRAFTPKDDNGSKSTVTVGGDGLTKRHPAGIWDEEILCPDCESRLGKYDQYAVNVFRDKKGVEWLTCADGLRTAYFKNVERRLLRGFIASVLWRCSVSNVAECLKINIGEVYKKRIADDLMNNGRFDYIDSLTFVLTDRILTHLLMLPTRKDIPTHGGGNVNGYRMNLPGLMFYISLDQRAHPLTTVRGVLTCDGQERLAATSLSARSEGLPCIIPDIGQDADAINELLPIVASHKQNKDLWRSSLITRGVKKDRA